MTTSVRFFSIALMAAALSACPSTPVANTSTCKGTVCNGVCVSLQSDVSNCGSCGVACSGNQVCNNSVCSSECTGGLTNCSRSCVNTTSDTRHCGACGNVCAEGSSCSNGTCVKPGEKPPTEPVCQDRVSLQSDGVLDFDVKTVTVSGKLTLNNARLPNTQTSSRGALSFRSKIAGTLATDTFSSTGEATYSEKLFAGTYDVYYVPSSGCILEEKIPCQSVLLKSNVALTSSGVLDFNLDSAALYTLSGVLTKNNQTMPSASSRGTIVFSDEKGGTYASKAFSSSGSASYSVQVPAGVYDVFYSPPYSCPSTPALPCAAKVLKSKVTVSASGVLDLNVQTLTLTGRVTKNSQAPISGDRGWLQFTLQNSKEGSIVKGLATSGDASYQMELFEGTYTVSKQSSSSCTTGGPFPCQSIVLQKDVKLSSSGALDFNVNTVTISGKLTKNGKRLPDDSQSRGALQFTQEKQYISTFFTNSGEATYRLELAAGTYDISYSRLSGCHSAQVTPCQETTLKTGVNLNASGAMDFDLQVVVITGELTKNGQQLPSNDRGSLTFTGTNASMVGISELPDSGRATYKIELFADIYKIDYVPTWGCDEEDAMPCQPSTLIPNQSLTADGVLDVNAQTVTVSGKLTENGKPLERDTNLGSLLFRRANEGHAQVLLETDTAPGTYSLQVFKGAYDILYQGACRADAPLPCQNPILRGCPIP